MPEARRWIGGALLVLLSLALIAALWLTWQWHSRPLLEPWQALMLEREADDAAELRVTWLGVSTLLFDDGETAILTDGFFSRPGVLRLIFGRIAPDEARIRKHLAQAGIDELAAVLVVHSHFDHVMDAPEVARLTGAMLVGSESTANVGRGAGLPESQIMVVNGPREMRLGDFSVTMMPSRHLPHGQAMGEITEPLSPPVRVGEYLEGGSYAVLVEHHGRSMLLQGSAGFESGALSSREAEVVFLGVGGLGAQDDDYLADYWNETVTALNARRVIPVHWDDFTRPLTRPLVPFPRLIDDFERTMGFLLQQGRKDGVEVHLMPSQQALDPFAE